MEWFQPNFRLWWKITTAVYLVAAFGLLFYWLVTDSGLYRVLDDLLTRHDGRYDVHYPKIVFLVLMLAMLLPLLVVRVAAGHRVRHVDPDNVMRF